MDTLTQEEMKEIYDALPEDVQDVLFAPETMDIYNQIQERYALDSAQRKALSMESGLVLMGLTEPKEYVLVLAEKLGIPRDKAAFIAQEVNRNIFHSVRESLKEIHQMTPPQEVPAPSAPKNPAVLVPRPPVPPAPTATPSTFDQKLGSTFRVATLPQAGVPSYGTPTPPVPVIPPPTPVPPQAPRAGDPYRELPL